MVHKAYVSMGWRLRGGALATAAVLLAGGFLSVAADDGPSLGAAADFAVLGASTVTAAGLTVVTGDLGVSPGTAITGFGPAIVSDGAIHACDDAASDAHSDAAIAYGYLAGMSSIAANNLTGTDLGGLTLAPGVYTFDAAAGLTGELTLDAQGDSNALFVIQVGSALTTASNSSVVVINGGANYDVSRVFWQIGGSATLGSGTAFKGNILAYASISIVSGASLTGRALAINAAVTMDSNSVSRP